MAQIFDNASSAIHTGSSFVNDPLMEKNRLRESQGGRILRYPTGGFDKTHGWIVFRELKDTIDRDTLLTKTTPTGNVVVLYLPQDGIQVKDQAQYENASLGLGGNIVERGDLNKFNAEEALNYVTKSISDAVSVISDPSKANLAVVTKVIQQAKTFAPANVSSAARSRIKRTANPYLRAIFEQVNRRSFNYAFEMVPDNAKDAKVIKDIISFFRTNLYPEVEGLPDQGEIFSDFVYKFPNKFQIEYYFDSKRIGHKILPCYLESVNVNFSNQSAMTFHPDGEFISSKLDLSFIEEKALNKNDIDPTKHDDGIGY